MSSQREKEEKYERIVFFLGAGASVPAGVPDTRKFIYGDKGFSKHILETDIEDGAKALNTVIDKLERRLGKGEADLEKVLESLVDLNNRDNSSLLEFFENKEIVFNCEELAALGVLEDELRKFIREKTIVTENSVGYLESLRSFVPLKIYSVNYDTCIEQFCNRYSLSYTDGFELYWRPKLFEKEEYAVKHYKLHGSVMWWLTDRDTYVKIPIKSSVENIELITGESAKNVITYPAAEKTSYGRPLHDLMSLLYQDLNEADVCVVVGYSFRDEDIKQIFFEIAEQNKDLLVVLISPSAWKIYNKQLKFRKGGEAFSSLEGRVVCLNYPIEAVLGTGFLRRSLESIREIVLAFEEGEEYRKKESGGWINRFVDCVMKCADIGYVEKAMRILEEYLGLNLENLSTLRAFKDSGTRFELFYKMGTGFLLNDRYQEAAETYQKLHSLLKSLFDLGCSVFYLAVELKELKETRQNAEKRVRTSIGDWSVPPDEKERLDENIQTKDNRLKELQKEGELRNSLFWCVHDSDWGKECFRKWIDFLKLQRKLLGDTKHDLVLSYLNPIISDSSQLWKVIEEPASSGRFDQGNTIRIEIFDIEIDRKKEAEEYFRSMLDSIRNLIDFCLEERKKRVSAS